MVDLWRYFWICETGTGQKVAQLLERYDDDDDDDDENLSSGALWLGWLVPTNSLSFFHSVSENLYTLKIEAAISDMLLHVYQIRRRFTQEGCNCIEFIFKYWIVFQ